MQKVTENKIREYVTDQMTKIETKEDLVQLIKYCVVNFVLYDQDFLNEAIPKLVEVKPIDVKSFTMKYVDIKNKI